MRWPQPLPTPRRANALTLPAPLPPPTPAWQPPRRGWTPPTLQLPPPNPDPEGPTAAPWTTPTAAARTDWAPAPWPATSEQTTRSTHHVPATAATALDKPEPTDVISVDDADWPDAPAPPLSASAGPHMPRREPIDTSTDGTDEPAVRTRRRHLNVLDLVGLLLTVVAVVAALQVPAIKRLFGYRPGPPTTVLSMVPSTTTTVRDPNDVMPTTVAGHVPLTVPAWPTGRTLTGSIPCPVSNSSEARVVAFQQAPTRCIDPTQPIRVRITTNVGAVTATLNTAGAPDSVNNFVVLARYRFFEGTVCWRIIPAFVAQCGDPVGDGSGGPGYTLANEQPSTGSYAIGSLVMSRDKASQFFFVTGDSPIPAGYTVLGRIDADQQPFLDQLNAAGTAHGFPTKSPVWITTIEILS